jgi:hypothetical protein
VAGGSSWTSILITTPEGYDGTTPGPLVIGLNANGWNLSLIENANEGKDSPPSVMARDFIIARFQRSFDHNWEQTDLEVFDQDYAAIAEALCFDESRVFGIGNAGGGRFIAKWWDAPPLDGVVRPAQFRAVALSGGIFFSRSSTGAEIPLVFVHSSSGKASSSLGLSEDGSDSLNFLKETRACSETSTPAGSNTLDDATTTCVDYDNCKESLRFCSYDQTTHDDAWQPLFTIEMHRFFTDYL